MFTGSLQPASNCATWSESYELSDEETGDLISLASVDEITLVVRDPISESPELTGTLTGGEIVVVSTGVFQWRFEATAMGALYPKTYEVGCIIEQDDDTVQLVIGTIAILDGIVS